MLSTPRYIGRFAPSPTGPLHFGSLYTALASYLDAKHHKGTWLLRIDDIDTSRVDRRAYDLIRHTLESFHLYWDGEIQFQQNHLHEYQNALDFLQKMDSCYSCSCSRQQYLEITADTLFCPCRNSQPISSEDCSYRYKNKPNPHIQFIDMLQGVQQGQPTDFILRRKDKLFSYLLSVVVDDHRQNITDVVRGADLLDATFNQIALYGSLGLNPPRFMHLPVIQDINGNKMSKQNHAEAVSNDNPEQTLWVLLDLLGQTLPPELKEASINTILDWSIQHWRRERIPRKLTLADPHY